MGRQHKPVQYQKKFWVSLQDFISTSCLLSVRQDLNQYALVPWIPYKFNFAKKISLFTSLKTLPNNKKCMYLNMTKSLNLSKPCVNTQDYFQTLKLTLHYLITTINCQDWLLCFNTTKHHGPLTNVKYIPTSLVLSFLIF